MRLSTAIVVCALTCFWTAAAEAQSLTTLFAANNGGDVGGAVYDFYWAGGWKRLFR